MKRDSEERAEIARLTAMLAENGIDPETGLLTDEEMDQRARSRQDLLNLQAQVIAAALPVAGVPEQTVSEMAGWLADQERTWTRKPKDDKTPLWEWMARAIQSRLSPSASD
jgi:hypothetical protein